MVGDEKEDMAEISTVTSFIRRLLENGRQEDTAGRVRLKVDNPTLVYSEK